MASRSPTVLLRQFATRRPAVLLAIGLVAAVVLWMATGVVSDGASPSTVNGAGAADPADAGDAELFAVAVVTRQAEEREARLVINGRTEPFRTVDVKAEIEGRLVELDTYRGRAVSQGDVIARIAQYDREARLAEARALLRQREVEYAASQRLYEQQYRSETQHAAAKAQLDAARAVVEQRETDVERTRIRAPFDGLIHDGHAELGDYVRAGDVVLKILDLDPILVVGSATEMEVSALALGDTAAAELVDGTVVDGIVTYVATQAEETTRTYRYEIEVPNPDYALRAGLTARTIVNAGRTLAHFVPSSALTLSNDGEVGIKTVDDDGIVRFHTVQIIEDSGNGLWLDGLPPQARVIVTGQEFVTEGQRVRAVEATRQGAAADHSRDGRRPPAGVDTVAEEPVMGGPTVTPGAPQ